MFTGIVEDLGEVEAVEHRGDSARIHVRSAVVTQDTRPGDSIAVNGVCLTVVGRAGGALDFDVSPETLRLTNLGSLKPGDPVNLEVDVIAKYVERLLNGHSVSGHSVSGHSVSLHSVSLHSGEGSK